MKQQLSDGMRFLLALLRDRPDPLIWQRGAGGLHCAFFGRMPAIPGVPVATVVALHARGLIAPADGQEGRDIWHMTLTATGSKEAAKEPLAYDYAAEFAAWQERQEERRRPRDACLEAQDRREVEAARGPQRPEQRLTAPRCMRGTGQVG
ncbi:conserved protein of unknown function (plasmid) [Rhodovastum atsumiense]|uniref:Uncharacterized protein n=1 Tax=Rhodovastum atsumiense TaxID=504468 RepID=A0A5M6IVH3_9PROT|nr:hypothetical protein [Rhodovastum atsumiense]KAA5611847.1 hypothetical protein F1189_12490 [Rhodovastum atsumiense]CAH2606180.1 conserved protein of unknown function [Rhodovastum atsumiense]